MSEAVIQQNIRLALGRDVTLFRNNIGSYKDDTGRLIRYGVCNPGGSDLIGFKTVTITPDMVGKQVAVFCAVEVKGPKGRATPEQKNFIQQVLISGGHAGIAYSIEDAKRICGL